MCQQTGRLELLVRLTVLSTEHEHIAQPFMHTEPDRGRELAGSSQGDPELLLGNFLGVLLASLLGGTQRKGTGPVMLSRRIEETILSGKATYPPERTLLTSGMTLFGVESLYRGNVQLNTPELDVRYQVEPLSSYWRG